MTLRFDEPSTHRVVMDVWCAIRTYSKHATELGNQIPEEPVFFLKPSSSVIEFGEIETCGGDVHHEIELVVKLGEGLKPTHMALGLDLTKRSIQDMLKEKRLPWAEAKAFTGAAVLGKWVEFDERANFQLQVNGKNVQTGFLEKMSWSVDELISKLADWAPIGRGDILFTGTPSGVGPLNAGDEVTALLYVDGEVVSTHFATCV
mgnify:CR=1 FL=1